MKGDGPAVPDDNEDDVPPASPGLPPYPTIGTVNVGAWREARMPICMVQDADMSGESGPGPDRVTSPSPARSAAPMAGAGWPADR